jgi:Domain of unknown function (DUF4913)
MSDNIAEWDQEPATVAPAKPIPKLTPRPGTAPVNLPAAEPPAATAPVEPQLHFGSVDEFVREKLIYTYSRRVGPNGQFRWDENWWMYPEAISRLDALWRAWEALRLEGTFGMSAWWRDHADHHMRMLMAPDGVFAASRSENAQGDPLPYKAPPAGMFVDVRTLPN